MSMGMGSYVSSPGSHLASGSSERLNFIIGAVNMATPGIAAVGAGFANLTAIGMRTASQMNEAMTMTQAGLMALGGISALAFGKATADAAGFEQKLKQIQAVSGDMDASAIAGISSEIKALSIKYGESANEIADAFSVIGRAGMKDSAAQMAVFESAIKMAKIEAMDLNTAIELLMDTTNMWGGDMNDPEQFAKSAEFMAEKMVQAAQMSTATVQELYQGMKFVGGTAKEVGWSPQETLGTLAYMKSVGISGSLSGTALRGLMTKASIMDPNYQEAMASIGLDMRDLWKKDAKGNAIAAHSPADLLKILHEAMQSSGLDQQEILAAWSKIGQQKTAQQLIKMDPDELDIFLKKMQESFDLQEKVDIAMDNLKTQFDRLMAAVNVASISIGEALLPYIRAAVDWLTEFAKWIAESKVATTALALALGSLTIIAAGLFGKWIWGGLAAGVEALKGAVTTVKTLGGVITGAAELQMLAFGQGSQIQMDALTKSIQFQTSQIYAQSGAVDKLAASWYAQSAAARMSQSSITRMGEKGPLTARQWGDMAQAAFGHTSHQTANLENITKWVQKAGNISAEEAVNVKNFGQALDTIKYGASPSITGWNRVVNLAGIKDEEASIMSWAKKNKMSFIDKETMKVTQSLDKISNAQRIHYVKDVAMHKMSVSQKRRNLMEGLISDKDRIIDANLTTGGASTFQRIFGFKAGETADMGKLDIFKKMFSPEKSLLVRQGLMSVGEGMDGLKGKAKSLIASLTTMPVILMVIIAALALLYIAHKNAVKRTEEAVKANEAAQAQWKKSQSAVDEYRKSLEAIPKEVRTKVQVDNLAELERVNAINKEAAVKANEKELKSKTDWLGPHSDFNRTEEAKKWGFQSTLPGSPSNIVKIILAGGSGFAGYETVNRPGMHQDDAIARQQLYALTPYAEYFSQLEGARLRINEDIKLTDERRKELNEAINKEQEGQIEKVMEVTGATRDQAKAILMDYQKTQYINYYQNLANQKSADYIKRTFEAIWIVVSGIGKIVWKAFESIFRMFGIMGPKAKKTADDVKKHSENETQSKQSALEAQEEALIKFLVQQYQAEDQMLLFILKMDSFVQAMFLNYDNLAKGWAQLILYIQQKVQELLNLVGIAYDITATEDWAKKIEDTKNTSWEALQTALGLERDFKPRTENEIRGQMATTAWDNLFGSSPYVGNFLGSGLPGSATGGGSKDGAGGTGGGSGKERLLKDGYNIDFILCSKKKLPDLDPNLFKKKAAIDLTKKTIDIKHLNINTRDRPEDIESTLRRSFYNIAESDRV